MIKVICSILGLMIVFISFGQTEFSGGIYNNTKWKKENSPYLITGDVAIFPDVTLTIEPGVKIMFNGSYYFEIRGILMAIGTTTDSIVFSSNRAVPQKKDWIGTKLSNVKNAKACFEYCEFSYADIANEVECCWDADEIYFHNCKFHSNNVAMMGYYGNKIYVNNCEFINNTIGILDGDKIISNSSFIENDYGLYNSSGSDAYNSTFIKNRIGYHGMRGVINNCLISENDIGVAPYYTNPDILHSIISNNRIGLQIQGLYNNVPGTVNECKICNNEIYNVELLNNVNVNLTTNCWCEQDSLKIAEKIYDGYDDIFLGLASFGLQGIDCENFVLTDVVIPTNFKEIEYEGDNFKFFPNPVLNILNVECINCTSEKEKNIKIFLYNSVGQCVLVKTVHSSTALNFDLSSFRSGIYFLNILYNGQIAQHTVVKN